MFESLLKTGLPVCLLNLLMNWYSKLLSFQCCVTSGVRQSISPSPSIFNVFMNVFIVTLRQLGNDCNVCGQFVNCILYADDIIILSASVRGLQNIRLCFEVSRDLHLIFNCAKSSCFAIGKGNKLRILLE